MFSPAARKPHLASQTLAHASPRSGDSPSTPAAEDRGPHSVPDRPATGTPAPWSSRLSVLARIPSVKKNEKGADANQIQPVYVAEFPQLVRSAQANILQKSAAGDVLFVGGLDKETSLSWIICGNKLYIWSYLSASVSKQCVVLEIPYSAWGNRDITIKSGLANHWMLCVVKWGISSTRNDKLLGQCHSAGIVICSQITQTVVYWPDIYSESESVKVFTFCPLETDLPSDGRKDVSCNQELLEHEWFNSIIVSAIPDSSHECIAIACQSNGDLWRFYLSPSEISYKKLPQVTFTGSCTSQINKKYARSLIWHSQDDCFKDSIRKFCLLTDHEIQCWTIKLEPDMSVTKLWAHEIVGNDNDLGIKKDLAGQKHIWLLDMQVDDRGKEFTILVATLCKDRVSSSSYTQYSLLTMQYKSGQSATSEKCGSINKVLEKKAPLQVIIPKARVEDEGFLFSMRLRVGGKPSGSVIILSGDGTATVANYWRGSTRLYQFDLPWDAGKVLDASVFPSSEDSEEGAWVVLTEKAGVWAIPEKAVLLGGVEPPERSLSRKGSSNEGAAEEERRSQAFSGNIIPRRASSDAWSGGDKQRAALTGIAQRTAQDEEAEALLGRLFQDFLLSGEVEGVFEKLREKGAFDKEGEMNVFTRMSKSIVDTLAKHWTTTRGAELVASAVVSSLLLDKQQRHKKYLQFLALSKCQEELSSGQRNSLLTIMEHGEKLSGMIQLRELQHFLSQNRLNEAGSPSPHSWSQMSGSLWNLIQLVGEKARRNTVLLMDRDNAEVFYSKVSYVEELYYCLSHHLQYIISGEQPYAVQLQQAYEISNACTALIQTAMDYRDAHRTWYPSPEGLAPWNCQPVVRSGLWSIASFIMQLSKEAAAVDMSIKSDFFSQLGRLAEVLLEAYTGSINSKIERREEHKGLIAEYCRRRDELLGSMYELAKRVVDAKYQDSCNGVEDLDLKSAILREVSLPLLSIAKRHEGYETLWNICYDLSDTGLLRSLMHDSLGPKGGFSNFVFKQLIKIRQFSKLLRLGEEFQEELVSFLKEQKDLLWLHELFLHQFSSASETLHAFALSQDDGPVSNLESFDEEPEYSHIRRLPSLVDRRRLLNLSKIAAMAGKDEDFEMKIRRIEADLKILKLQEEIVKRCCCSSDNEERKEDMAMPLPPGELIEMCLEGEERELCLLGLEVFAWTSSWFRNANRSLIEECWKKAADVDDWSAMYEASRAEEWSGNETAALGETMLFKASRRCYGPDAECYDGGFQDVLPLQREDDDFSGGSVQGILMQHKDFPDAGRLMMTAITMGKVGSNCVKSEEEDEDRDMDCI